MHESDVYAEGQWYGSDWYEAMAGTWFPSILDFDIMYSVKDILDMDKKYLPRFVVPKSMASRVYQSKKFKAQHKRVKKVDFWE